MREEPRTREEKVEALREVMTRMPHLQIVWNGYDIAVCRTGDRYTVLVKVISKHKEQSMIVISCDSSMKPYDSRLMEGETAQGDTFYGDPKDLPENLQSCEQKLIDFILEQDWEKQLDDLDGWTKERNRS